MTDKGERCPAANYTGTLDADGCCPVCLGRDPYDCTLCGGRDYCAPKQPSGERPIHKDGSRCTFPSVQECGRAHVHLAPQPVDSAKCVLCGNPRTDTPQQCPSVGRGWCAYEWKP